MIKTNQILSLGVSLISLTFSLNATAAETCTVVPSCADLGYTDTSCNGKSLKCPFDNSKLFCQGLSGSDVLNGENGETCAIGSIVYCDGTCSSSYNIKKIPLGIYISSAHIIALTDSGNLDYRKAQEACSELTVCGHQAFLPKLIQIQLWRENLTVLNNTLSKVSGANNFKNSNYWTNTPWNYNSGWYTYNPTTGSQQGQQFNEGEAFAKETRCIFAF